MHRQVGWRNGGDRTVIRLALLPPAAPTRWWGALAEALAAHDGVEVLWVSDEPAADPRVGWLPITAGSPPTTAGQPHRAAAPPPTGTDGAALVVDVRAPRADVVAAMAADLPVLTVSDAPLDAATEALARHGRRLLVPSAALARTVPVDLAAVVVPALEGGDAQGDGPGSDTAAADATARPLEGAPTVAVLGAPLTDHVRLAWAPITQRWPDAVLIGDVDGLAPEARAIVLQDAHVVVVLDAGGTALGEALAAGATVIAHADPEASAVLTHGVDGLLTDARAPQQLAGSLLYALDYHEQLASLRRAGRALAHRRFSVATLAERVLAQLGLGDGTGSGPAATPAGSVPLGARGGPDGTVAQPEVRTPVAAGPAEVTAARSAI